MPKRGIEITDSPKEEKGLAVTSPVEKKILKLDGTKSEKEKRRSISSESDGQKRKRSLMIDQEHEDKVVGKKVIQSKPERTIPLLDIVESTNDIPGKNAKISEGHASTSLFTINREDPIGLVALRKELFALLPKILQEDDMPFVIKGIKSIFNTLNDEDSPLKRQNIDYMFRDYMLENVIKNPGPWDALLRVIIVLSKDGVASALLPIALLVDLIDLMGLEECEAIFQFIEDRLDLWQEPFFYTQHCKNAMLRMCNDLLRRLSQTQNTIFCGRILIFLSTYFPFSERSGLNVMSEFNIDNVTVYKTTDGSDDPEDNMDLPVENEETLFEGMDIEIPGLDKVVAQCREQKKKTLNVDYNMYVKFWSLQDFLHNPNLCFNKVHWKTFTVYLLDLLQALESAKLLAEPAAPSTSSSSEMEVEEADKSLEEVDGVGEIIMTTPSTVLFPESKIATIAPPTASSSSNLCFTIPKLEDENQYFAKYLTNRRVLELEMCDPQFRRSFLVQVLIVLQYLVLPVKFKTDSQVLNEEQTQFVSKTTERIFTILSQIKPGGIHFVENVKHILKREEIWNKWKNDGCVAIKKPTPPPVSVSTDPRLGKEKGTTKTETKKNVAVPGVSAKGDSTSLVTIDSQEFEEAAKPKPIKRPRPPIGFFLKRADLNTKFSLGNMELNRLWNIAPDNLGACRAKTRDFMPSIETYFGEAMKELDQDPVTPFDPKREIKPKKILGNTNFGWRGLRLLARRSPYFFQMVSGTPIHPLQNYLEFVLRKIAADIEVNSNQSLEAIKLKAEPNSSTAYALNNKVQIVPNKGDKEAEPDSEAVTPPAEEDEELNRPESGAEEDKDNEGEEIGKDIRNLSEYEQILLGKRLGTDWKKLGVKLGFTMDEVEYFSTEHKEDAGFYMLQRWTEQEGEDATIADLLYRLDGLGLRGKAEGIFVI